MSLNFKQLSATSIQATSILIFETLKRSTIEKFSGFAFTPH